MPSRGFLQDLRVGGGPERGRVSLGHRSHIGQHHRCHFVYFKGEGVKICGGVNPPDILGGG